MGDLKIKGYTVAQSPNPPLFIALLALIAGWFLDEGTTPWGASRAVFFVATAIWAWQELADGVNGFRRVLGALGLGFVIFSITRDLS